MCGFTRTFGEVPVSGWDVRVNVLGCLVIGLLSGIAEQRRIFNPEFRLFVFLGILGGFTTFSARRSWRDLLDLYRRVSAQEFLKILEPWVTLGRLTNSGEVFYGEKTSEGFDI
jgi:fluoride ion exporter CrcB/FEX